MRYVEVMIMAFMGIFALSMILMVFFIIIVCVILFVFIPCLIIFIINLIKGIANKWPKKNLAGTIITGIILSILISFAAALFIVAAILQNGNEAVNASSSQAAIALQYLLLQI